MKKKMSNFTTSGLFPVLRDIAAPVVILYLASFAAATAIMGTAGVLTGAGSFDADALTGVCPQLPLLCSIGGYALTLAAILPLVRFDELRFGRTFPVIPLQKSAAAASVSGLAGSAASGHAKYTASGRGWRPGPRSVLYIAAVSVLAYAWSRILLHGPLPALFPAYQEQAAGVFDGRFPALMFLSYVLLGPVAEELVFRCCLYRRFRLRTGWPAAAVFSSLLFGIWHGNVIQFLYASVLGLALAWGYEKSGRISLCMAAHICANLLAFAVTVLSAGSVFGACRM